MMKWTKAARLGVWAGVACCGAVTGEGLGQSASAPVILQWFDSGYEVQRDRIADAFSAGYGQYWLPPTGRAETGGFSVGYDVFDRFDLGQADNRTLYGSRAGLEAVVGTAQRHGASVYVDFIANHNGFASIDSFNDEFEGVNPFEEQFFLNGGYPGFVLQDPDSAPFLGDVFGIPNTFGDFHPPASVEESVLTGRLAGLNDINHSRSDIVLIRQPTEAGNPLNIPAGEIFNRVDPNNAQFYPDQALGREFVDANGNTFTRFDFNTQNPLAGDATPETALNLIARNAQWLVQVIGVDGLRLDAAQHFDRDLVLGALDQAVFQASDRFNLDGSQRQVFSFSEVFNGDLGFVQSFVEKSIDPNSNRVGANRDALDFPLNFAIGSNFSSNGLQNNFFNVVNAGLDANDDGFINGSSGVVFVGSHDEEAPALNNVAHAFALLRPGNTIVYYDAATFGDRDFPKTGRGDALGNFGDTITNLVDVRNSYGRGNYFNRLVEQNQLAYEREDSVLVLLSNRNDSGTDARSFEVGFDVGDFLVELTGNAAANGLAQVIQVQDNGSGGGFVNATFLRNDGQDKGFLLYGLARPESALGLELSNVAQVLEGPGTVNPDGTPGFINAAAEAGSERLTDIAVIQSETFDVTLRTRAVFLDTDGDGEVDFEDFDARGDNALLRINEGIDTNGNGFFDFTNPNNDVTYAFEQFSTANAGVDSATGEGFYTETIDTTQLEEGLNFITGRVFRQREGGGPAIFRDFREVVYVDLLAPEVEVARVTAFSEDGDDLDFDLRSLDQTADTVHVFLNLAASVTDEEILSFVGDGNEARQLDIETFRFGFFDVGAGNNVITAVTIEETGTFNIQRLAGISLDTGRGVGVGDVNFDGEIDSADIANVSGAFEALLFSRNTQFNAAADLNGDGRIDNNDLFAFLDVLLLDGADAQTFQTYEEVLTRRGDTNGNGTTDGFDLLHLRDNLGLTADEDAALFDLLDVDVDGDLDGDDAELLVVAFFGETTGDLTRDGEIDLEDAEAFALGLLDAAAFEAEFGTNTLVSGDVNRDFLFDLGDLDPFL
ncbi:MAG: dockerin type I domain-containing protein, partial [Planctomycetota bacterium]